jgi:hypothetical protein
MTKIGRVEIIDDEGPPPSGATYIAFAKLPKGKPGESRWIWVCQCEHCWREWKELHTCHGPFKTQAAAERHAVSTIVKAHEGWDGVDQ